MLCSTPSYTMCTLLLDMCACVLVHVRTYMQCCIFSIETVAASHPVVMTSCASTAVVTMCEVPPSSLLTPSLFRGLPPVIHFPRPDEKCEEFIDFNPDYKSLVLSASHGTIFRNHYSCVLLSDDTHVTCCGLKHSFLTVAR